MSKDVIHTHTYAPRAEEVIRPRVPRGGHQGGDRVIMDSFVEAVRSGSKDDILTPVSMSLDSHVMAFAAEEARRSESVVTLDEFVAAHPADRKG